MVNAYFRAAHCRLDPEPWILEDRVAGELLPGGIISRLESARSRWPADLTRLMPGLFATRSRLAEDVALAGLADGRADYVILGAGLDTFAWRHPRASEFVVWEIDLPETQAWKRRRLAEIGLAEPANVQFVAVDLTVTPPDALDLPKRATWNWMGLTLYLEKVTTAATLRAIAAMSEEAVVVVEFPLALEHCDELGRAWRKEMVRFASSVGEPYVALFAPDEATELVINAGFEPLEMLDAEQLTTRYLRQQPHLRLAHVVLHVIAKSPDKSRAPAQPTPAWRPNGAFTHARPDERSRFRPAEVRLRPQTCDAHAG
jgi:methyltransferase (TIGR00027 family)